VTRVWRRSQRGSAIIELLVAAVVLMAVAGAAFAILHQGLAAAPALEESSDLHQRARVASAALVEDLRAAHDAGTPLALSPVDPRGPGDPAGTAVGDTLTVRYPVEHAARGRLAQRLDPGVGVALLEAAGCPAGTTACGFTASAQGLITDGVDAVTVAIDGIGPGTLVVRDLFVPRPRAFAPGSAVIEVTQVTYRFDPLARQLLRSEGAGTFVLVDNVIAASFAYLDAIGTVIPLARFADGPFLGSGALQFDADLRLVRAVRVQLRFDTPVDRLRGVDPRMFRRPGTATGWPYVADVDARFDVALRRES
jgi:hypothetical protein